VRSWRAVSLQVLERVLVGSLQERVLKNRRALWFRKRVPAVQADLLARAAARAKLNDRVFGRAFLTSEAQHLHHPHVYSMLTRFCDALVADPAVTSLATVVLCRRTLHPPQIARAASAPPGSSLMR